MRSGKPSSTAERVALRRAAHQLLDEPKVFDDPIALKIVGAAAEADIRAHPRRHQGTIGRYMRALLVARSRYCEDALAVAVGRGVRQCVILGAGLDTFAYRSPLAAEVKVFEVDHPATQAWKRRRLAETGITVPASLTFAPVDFESEPLADGLSRAGVDLAAPVFFSWLGVVYYLTRDTAMSTLRFVASLPAGSEIVFDYSDEPQSLDLPARIVFRVIIAAVAGLGEPWRTYFRPEALKAELSALGFGEIEDLDGPAMNARYFADRDDGLKVGGLIHLVRARVGAADVQA